MRRKTKISIAIFALGLILPGLMYTGAAVTENWGVATDDEYLYTFGIGGEINLPSSVYEYLSPDFAENLNEDFNNSYGVGYAMAYEEAYDDGFNNISGSYEDPWTFTNPYSSSYLYDTIEEGLYWGYQNGYPDGYQDNWYALGNRSEIGNYDNWAYDEYYGVPEFPGFPQSELDAVDLETIYTEFMNMEKVFNLNITLKSMSEMTTTSDYFPSDEYYYDVMNVSMRFKVASESEYLTFEEFVYNYVDTHVRAFINDAFVGSPNIAGNITAQIDDFLVNLNNEITAEHFMLENVASVWGTGQNADIIAREITDTLLYDVLGNFGFNMEREYTYEYGYTEAYAEGYDVGFVDASYNNPYNNYYNDYTHGQYNGWDNGYWDGYWAQYDGYGYGTYYYDPYSGADEYQTEVQQPPSGYIRLPFFVPQDLDVGAQIETMKDAINIQLGQSHLITLGGFNGLVDQLGMDFITDEKQVYISGNIEDPKWLFGKMLDLGSMLFLDQVNEELDLIPELDFGILNDSLNAEETFNVQWDQYGVLVNMHQEMSFGVDLIPSFLAGATIFMDISLGEYTALNAHYGTTTPTQKPYPTTVFGNWGVDEGSVNDFTSSFDLNVEMPQSMWDTLNEQLWMGMNETYYDWTGMNLPESEEVDSELIFETLMGEIPNVINLQSKVTDMLGIQEGNETDYAQYDFLAQYLLAKTPEEASYEPLGMLFNNVYEGFYDAIGTSFPPSFADEVQARLDVDLTSLISSSMIEGTNVSVFELIQQFVPTTLHLWGVGGVGADLAPAFAQEMGIMNDFYFNLLSEGAAFPSILYTPTDFVFEDVYNDLIPFLESELPSFTEEELFAFLTSMSVDDFYVEGKQVYLRLDIETLDDIFFTTTNTSENLEDFIDMVGSEFGEQFVYDSVWGQILFNWEYDANGILKNLHLQLGAGMETTGGEELSFAVEMDMSHGEFAGKNGQFPGAPLIHGYDHWLYPDLTYSLILPQGNGNVINIDSMEHDVHMSLQFSSANPVRVQTQIWGNDPSTSSLFVEGTGVFFAIDVDDETGITFPMTLTVDLRPEILALGNASVIEDLFRIYSWDETTDNWVLEDGFGINVDTTAGTVEIQVNHLSAFAIGAYLDTTTDDDGTDDTTDDATDDDGGPFGNIPGYGLSFFLISMVGTAAVLLMRKRK